MERWVVRHYHRAGVRSAAHIEFHTGYCFVAGGTGKRCQRVLIPTNGPTTMRDEVHATYPDARENCHSIVQTGCGGFKTPTERSRLRTRRAYPSGGRKTFVKVL